MMIDAAKDLITFNTPFEEVRKREVGGKGWNLFRLLSHGFPVPPFYIITSSVFDSFIDDLRELINCISGEIDFFSGTSIEHNAQKIKDLILDKKLPKSFYFDFKNATQRIFGNKTLFSVRSSVIGEDSTEHSFAGQMDSFLNIGIEDLVNTVKKVWASVFSARALTYRYQKHISLKDVSAAVIVQQMVQSISSGVMFTTDQAESKQECIISAGYGLGEGIVSNSVETDTYRIDHQSGKLSKDVHVKDFRIVLDHGRRSGCRKEPLPSELKSKNVLTDSQIRQLYDIGTEVEKRFSLSQDVEWAFDRSGILFILQARPIVQALKKGSSRIVRIWDNSNIIESYPGLTLPLTFTFICSGYESTFRNATRGLVLFKKKLKKQQDIFKNMIGLINGHVYYNLLNWYEMLSHLPGFKRHKDSWDQMIGISQKISFPQSKLSPLNFFCSVWLVLWRLISVRRTARRFFRYFGKAYTEFGRLDLSKASEDELIAVYEALNKRFKGKWHLTIYNDFCAMKYYDWLKKLCSKWTHGDYPNIHNNLMCGEHGIESVEPVRSLIRIAELFRLKPIYRELIDKNSNSLIWEKIQNEPAYSSIKDALNTYLQAYGDRGLEELKLEKATFREQPARLIELVRNYYNIGLSVKSMVEQEQNTRKDAEATVNRKIKNPLKRLIFWFILKQVRRAIVNRENMRFARSRLYGIVRRLFRRMGELFEEKNLINSSSDIHYLTVNEIFGIVQGTSVVLNLKALVELRKKEYRKFKGIVLDERFITTDLPGLSTRSESRKINRTKNRLRGVSCFSGTAEDPAKVVFNPQTANGNGSYILVAESTDPGWVFLMISSKGIVVERGSVLSHTAIIGRELGIPTIVGVKDATKLIPNGTRIFINGSTGEIRW